MVYENLTITGTAPANNWTSWRESIKNKEPETYGDATVCDRGLYYQEKSGNWQTMWEDSTHDGLDAYNRKLNAEGLTRIHRAYKFKELSNKFPGKIVSINVLATKQAGWPADKLKIGDKVELFVWREQEYTQIAYKKKE